MRTVTRDTLVTVHACNRLEDYAPTSHAHSQNQDYELTIHNPVLYTSSFLPT